MNRKKFLTRLLVWSAVGIILALIGFIAKNGLNLLTTSTKDGVAFLIVAGWLLIASALSFIALKIWRA